jgi:glycosyltransferase involved in cell wall biosynthesis
LIIPWRANSIKSDPFGYYRTNQNFKITRVFCLDFFQIKIIPTKISFYLQSISFSFFAIIYAFSKYGKGGGVYYSRDYFTQLLLCRLNFRPTVEIHDYRSLKPEGSFRAIVSRARKIIVNSSGTKKFLQAHYLIPDEKFLVAPNGVDVRFFEIPENKEEVRKMLGAPADSFIAGYVGRLETVGMEKGINYLIEAFETLSHSHNNLLFYVIGGPDSLIKIYKKKMKELDISENRFIFTGQVAYEKIPLYLRAMDVAVIPFPNTRQFANTCSPIKIFEFLAAGKAIIASDLPSIREVLSEKECLFFVPEKSSDLAEKIEFLLKNPEEIKNMSLNALHKSQGYTWQKRAGKILQFINLTSNI